jgi:predicted DNA-binding antitoxin AbrB/MazE fold protein
MGQRVRAVYDGQVLRPEEPVALRPGVACTLIVEEDRDDQQAQPEYVLTSLARLATDLGLSDLAERHTEYAHGHSAHR